MWGLLRLLLLSLALGAVLAASTLTVRSLRLLFYPGVSELGILSGMRLPRMAEPYRLPRRSQPRICSGLADFSIAVFWGLSLSVFYFAENDGIPRLFSLLAVALGAYLLRRIAGRPLWRILILLCSCLRAFILIVSVVSHTLLLRIGKHFLAFLGKATHLLIKRLERLYTKHASRRYMKRSSARLGGSALRRTLSSALDAEGGQDADR